MIIDSPVAFLEALVVRCREDRKEFTGLFYDSISTTEVI
jgi:hypothetical protein